jgi:hypothetical protein
LAKKEGHCTEEDVEEEEDELFDEEKCPTVVKKSMVECGVKKFKAKVDDFKDKLQNADNATECKDIGFRTVIHGYVTLKYDLRLIARRKRKTVKRWRCTVGYLRKYHKRRNTTYEERIEKAKKLFGTLESKIEEVYDKLEDDDVDCKNFTKSVPHAFRYFAWLAKKEGHCTEEDVEEEEDHC